MFFQKAKPKPATNSMQAADDAKRDIHDAIERHDLGVGQAARLLQNLADQYRIYALNSAPSLTTPQTTSGNIAPPPKALDALARLIAGKAV